MIRNFDPRLISLSPRKGDWCGIDVDVLKDPDPEIGFRLAITSKSVCRNAVFVGMLLKPFYRGWKAVDQFGRAMEAFSRGQIEPEAGITDSVRANLPEFGVIFVGINPLTLDKECFAVVFRVTPLPYLNRLFAEREILGFGFVQIVRGENMAWPWWWLRYTVIVGKGVGDRRGRGRYSRGYC